MEGRGVGCSRHAHPSQPTTPHHTINTSTNASQRPPSFPCAGPPIAWLPGRLDSLGPGPSAPAYSSRLPGGGFNAAGLLYYFTNLGLTVREGVALMGGGHSLGG